MREYGILGLIVLIIEIFAIIEIFKSSMDMTHKLLWTVLILVFPIVGLLIYYFFGRGGGLKAPKV